jgi:hypothetical protein
MTELNRGETELDRRLRRLHARLDTSADFMPRLSARIAVANSPRDERSRALLRARLELERGRLEAALTRRLWRSLAATGLVTAGAIAIVWLLGPSLGARLVAGTQHVSPIIAWAAGCLGLAGGIAYLARRGLPHDFDDLAFG